jgi:hypothetical protein
MHSFDFFVFVSCSTFFLNGPVAQVKSMFAADRFIATLMYLGTLALTLGLALSGQPVGWVVAALILQVIAMCWYALSYIPYGRESTPSWVSVAFLSLKIGTYILCSLQCANELLAVACAKSELYQRLFSNFFCFDRENSAL